MACVAELVRLGKHSKELADAGIRVVTLTADGEEAIREAVADFSLPFEFVSDRDGSFMDRLGLRDVGAGPKGRDAFLATTFLIDADRTVRLRHVASDVRDRLSVEDLLEAARAMR